MDNIYKYIVIFVVGATADIIVNFLVSSMQNPTGIFIVTR